jgi:hypothetical protein
LRRTGGTVNISNSILSGQNIGQCSSTDGTITDGGYNLATDSSCGFVAVGSQVVTSEQLSLGNLAPNGGPTQTILPSKSSIAVDAIPSATNGCGTIITADQRGIVRPLHGKCDIGAVESYRVSAQLISD